MRVLIDVVDAAVYYYVADRVNGTGEGCSEV